MKKVEERHDRAVLKEGIQRDRSESVSSSDSENYTSIRLLKKESLTHGIQVSISDDNRIKIDFHVIVAYGVSISAVTDNLISNVKYRVEEFSGMPVDKINIYIEGVRVID